MNNYSYIYSIIELYLKNECDTKKANLIITKQKDKVELRFNMEKENPNKSTFQLPLAVINQYITNIIKVFKGELLVIDEKYELDSRKKKCYYLIKFSNGRTLSFKDFSVLEINNLRNILYNITMRKEEIRVNLEKEETPSMNYKPRLVESGFVSFKSLLLMVLFFVGVLVVSLWVFYLM